MTPVQLFLVLWKMMGGGLHNKCVLCFWKMMGHVVVEHSLGSLATAKDS